MILEILTLLLIALILLSYFHSPSQYYLKFTWYFLSIFISTAVIIPFACFRPGNLRNAKWTYKIHEFLCSLFLGIKWEIIGENRLKKNFPCVTICNHQSSIDLLLHSIISWRMSGFIATAKKSVQYMFPIGPNGMLSGVVFIDRSRGKASREMIREAAEKCHDTGATLCLFPEGTRNMKSELLPFKTGAFDAAVKAKLPIVPVVASPYYFLDHKNKKFSSGRVIVSVLPPIPTTHDMDAENLSQEVRNIMNEEYKRLSSLILENNNKSELF